MYDQKHKYATGTHLLEDDSSVELSTPDELINKIGQVEEVDLLINVPRNKDGAVDAFCRNGSPHVDLRAVFVKRDAPVWVLARPHTVVLIKKIK